MMRTDLMGFGMRRTTVSPVLHWVGGWCEVAISLWESGGMGGTEELLMLMLMAGWKCNIMDIAIGSIIFLGIWADG